MQRSFLAVAAAALLMVGCAQTAAPPAPAPAKPAASSSPSSSVGDKNLPSPLINQPGGGRVITGGSQEVCLQQCERSYQICMDGSTSRSDTLSGTMYDGRMFGPAARCETSLSSCLKRCKSAVAKN